MNRKYQLRTTLWIIAALFIAVLACNLPGIDSAASDDAQFVVPGPVVAFQEPIAGIQVDLNQPFPIFVSARDVLGVVRLDLWVDDVLVLSQSAPETEVNGVNPLTLSYGMMGTEPGTHSMVARAYNSAGALGESLVVHVTVSNVQAAAPDKAEQIHYIAQDGDTVDSIANDTGSSASVIQDANPGVKGPLNPGQVVVVPGARSNQPPAQPAKPPAGQQGGQQGGQPGGQANILPGLLPIQPPGGAVAIPGFQPGQGGVVQIAPNIFPGFQPIQNGTNPDLSAPDSLTVLTNDCKVTLNWKDNSANESGFTVYRRLKPDQVAPQYVATVAKDQTSYVDDVPHPGTYEYAVEAQGKLEVIPQDQVAVGVIQQNMISTSRSAPVYVEVKPTSACIDDPNRVKYIHVKTLGMEPKRGGSGFAALWYSINNSPGRRLPKDQGQYIPTGDWQMPDEVVSVTSSFFLNPDQHITAKFWSSAYTRASWSDPRGPTDLGEAYNSHLPSDIEVKDDRYYIAQNDNFKVEYKIWVEDLKWTGKGTTTDFPAPTNLRVKRTTTNSRVITWDWHFSGAGKNIDGFLLYRSYSCPGMDTQIYAPVIIASPKQETEIPFRSEPMGCLYRYEVSAYGRQGESGRSNKLEGDSEAAYAIAGVTFKTLKINDMPYGPGGAQLKIYVNDFRRLADVYWLKEASYDLKPWTFDGRRPHNALGLALAEKEFLTIRFSVSGVDTQGYVAQDSVCKGAGLVPPVASWKQDPWTLTIKTPDGSCELTVELTGQQPTATSSGGVVFAQADLAVTKLERIGYRLFAYIENKGPETLYNNRIGYGVTWGLYNDKGEFNVDGPWAGETIINVQSNLPQWISLGDYVDQNFVYFCAKDLENCERGFRVEMWEAGIYEKPKNPNFKDPNPDNNLLIVRGKDIEQMK
ncbi:MAG: LysM peptidoglycan-binding domain-containing protein [Chloroflexi bacterium]|nr:LysM peptidoglycan-binding domain-containing protein [Chloroflexota bacterium]